MRGYICIRIGYRYLVLSSGQIDWCSEAVFLVTLLKKIDGVDRA